VSRIVNVAGCVALFARLGGIAAAQDAVRQRRRRLFDPAVVDAFLVRPAEVLGDPNAPLADLEPNPTWIPDGGLPHVLRIFGDAVDLKSTYFHGHAAAVSALAAATATRLGLSSSEVADVELAGHVLDLGRVAVPTAVWDHPGALGPEAIAQVRLHPHYSEQIVTRSATLAPLARCVGSHHERLDGSGYHRGRRAADLPAAARVLAVADAWHTLRSDRPHRTALAADRAAADLQERACRRALDAEVVTAVLDVAGAPRSRRNAADAAGAAGAVLTDRQREVIRLIADGLSNAAIGARLGISRRTAEHHVQDVYTRIGVSSRAGAAMYAMDTGCSATPGRRR
jgi:DNA-binding CsgD family transcriptional regulator